MKALKALLIGLTLLCPASAMAQDFPEQADQADRALPAGRTERHHRARGRPAHVGNPQADDHHRKPLRPGRRGRHRRRRQVAKPDGYTIAITSAGALAISPSMEKVAYETLKDLQPITLVAKVPEMLVVATSVPANNMKELVALAKSAAGQAQLRLLRRRQPAASRRRIVQAHRQDRHHARALPRRRAGGERPARPAGADGVPRPAGAAAADQGRQAQADRGRRAAARAERARRADHRRSRHARAC